MRSGTSKMFAASILVILAMLLDLTSRYSPVPLVQLIFSLALVIAGALVALRGVVDFLSERV